MGDPGAGADRDHAWCWCPGQKEGADLILIGASRSRTCCRHFLLAQLGDGRHVVLGEDSAHARLQDLLLHYTACPLSPYGETLSEPLARQVPIPTPARTLTLTPGTQARAPPLPPHAELRPQDLARRFPFPRRTQTSLFHTSLLVALPERCVLVEGSLRNQLSHTKTGGAGSGQLGPGVTCFCGFILALLLGLRDLGSQTGD